MNYNTDIIALASLAIALLAVVVGPWISWRVAQHQAVVSRGVANKQIIAPMRQAWIEKLRDRVAHLLSLSWWYYVSGRVDESDEDDDLAGSKVERRLRFLLQEIELTLNLSESDHVNLLNELTLVVNGALEIERGIDVFPEHHTKASELCRKVLKREWEVVKREG